MATVCLRWLARSRCNSAPPAKHPGLAPIVSAAQGLAELLIRSLNVGSDQLWLHRDDNDTVGHAKCAGIAQEDACRAPLPSSPLTTISGLASHLRWLEYSWFEVVLLGEEDSGPWTDEDPDPEMRIALEIPIAQLLAEYQSTCARYRGLVASLDLETPSKRTISTGEPVTLRWILLHMIEETARHNGHLGILRQLADGVTGM
jgi:uncharacterized damage-inducible protein DinB